MKNVISGVDKFQKEVFPEKADQFKVLATGQSPEVLFITCSDSRIDPNLLTQTSPGELFICRNAGNVVPPHSNETGGMTASIEYAVAALGVSHIVVCGHTDCGAMKGAIHVDELDAMPHVKVWLGHCRGATEVVKQKCGEVTDEHLLQVTKENIVLQLQNLRTHPAVASYLAVGKIKLHGWLYDIETGGVVCYDGKKDDFLPIDKHYAEEMASKEAISI
jgi:carbonic anhydrase